MNALRRARPAMGTFVEIGVCGPSTAVDTVFDDIAALEAVLSRFQPSSDIARFNALAAGASIDVRGATCEVLDAARSLFEQSDGLFDISAGTSPQGWSLDDGARLRKLDEKAQLDLGGIAKGYIVDCAVRSLIDSGATAGWVNAGGDLRVFGDVELPIVLRGRHPSTTPFAHLSDGAFATSQYGFGARSQLSGCDQESAAHVSVAAPLCLWADALTKIVALTGDAAHPLLDRHGAQAWRH